MSVGLDDERMQNLLAWGQNCTTFSVDTAQRLLVLVANVVLIFMAFVALWSDRSNSCDENLHLYAGFCLFLLFVDTFWELIRCNKESNLDRLQSHSWDTVGTAGTRNLLSCDDSFGQMRLSPSGQSARRPEISAASPWQHVGKEKSSMQKRLADLQRWSVFFTCFVAVLFSFFSSHDLDCSMNSPSLYNYIHNFTYVFILRLGVNILTFYCRTIKDYQDAAATAEAAFDQKSGAELRRF